MENFFVISPNIEGDGDQNNIRSYLDIMYKNHTILMGWGKNDRVGRRFFEMENGDYVICARGKNKTKQSFFAGRIASEPTNDYPYSRKLSHFINLNVAPCPISFSEQNTNGASTYPPPAIYQLHPENNPADKTICEIIERLTNKCDIMKQNIELLLNNHNLILTGAPGTGKTYLAKQIAQQMIFDSVKEEKDFTEAEKLQFNDQCAFVQFHPSYDYTDFVEGLRPVQDKIGNVGFKRHDGVFKDFCKNALNNPNKKFVFIIDEINRGETSKIFGELFFSIDPGYRGEKGKVRTQYANMQTEPNDFDDKLGIIDDNNFGHFFVPENVYIIGTMNDIDRSVESMDFAMRRRFAFKEIKADDRIDMLKESEKLSLDFDDIEKRMRNLNNCILSIQGLSSAYQIGASYFLKLENYLVNDQLEESSWTDLWNNHIEGLMFEYLRGTPNTAKDLEKLKNAYMNPDGYKYDNDGKVVAEDNTNE